LLALLNQPGPGSGLVAPLVGCFLLTAADPGPGRRLARLARRGRPAIDPAAGRRAARRRRTAPSGRRAVACCGSACGLATTRRVRLLATLASLAICTSFVLLMLALAAELNVLANDPTALGRRYQLSASLPASAAPRVRALRG